MASEIVARVTGGLGNQMFQYAAALATARAHGAQVAIDHSHYDYVHEANRSYRLDVFNVSGRIATGSRTRRLIYHLSRSPKPLLGPISSGLRVALRVRDIREPGIERCEPSLLEGVNRAKRYRLIGYWMSPRYFAGYEKAVREEFSFRDPPPPANQEVLARICDSENSVSLHIRRGDFLKVRPGSVLPLEYYRLAVRSLQEWVANMTVFVFSDAPVWAKENLDLPCDVVPVDVNDEGSGHEDMRLMASCDHHIIANSSFSWWGAWLNPSPKKIVIGPRTLKRGWERPADVGPARSDQRHEECSDLYPIGWLCL